MKDNQLKDIIYEGYIVEGTLEENVNHPLTPWFVGILEQFKDGCTLKSLKKAVKGSFFPYPKNKVLDMLLKEMLVEGVLEMNYSKSTLHISKRYQREFKSNKQKLFQSMMATKKQDKDWWMDGLEGELIPILTVQTFDENYGQKPKGKRILVNSAVDPLQLLFNKNMHLRDAEKKVHGSNLSGRRKDSFVSLNLRLKSVKNLNFLLTPAKNRFYLPSKLDVLGESLEKHYPKMLINGNAKLIKPFQLQSSTLVNFHLVIEKNFLDYIRVEQTLAKETFSYYLSALKEHKSIFEYYREAVEVKAISGNPEVFFNHIENILNLGEIHIVTTSSFLNPNNSEKLAKLLHDYPTSRITLLYGHANDDTMDEHTRIISQYIKSLNTDSSQLSIIPTRIKSHEKILVSNKGHWMLSSWNIGSSHHDSSLFESGLAGQDNRTANLLLDKLEELADFDFLKLGNVEYWNFDEEKDELEKAFQNIVNVVETSWDRESYDAAILILLQRMRPFLKRTRIQLVEMDNSRDAMVQLTNRAQRSLFLASDSVSTSGLDHSYIKTLSQLLENKVRLAILWGRQFEKDKLNEDTEKSIEVLTKLLQQGFISTQLKPMENHAKFAIYDELGGIITSDNLLNYGGIGTETDSRELGIFFTSPVVARELLGHAILHRYDTFKDFSRHNIEWYVLGNMKAKQLSEFFTPPHKTSLVKSSFEIQFNDESIPNIDSIDKLHLKAKIKSHKMFWNKSKLLYSGAKYLYLDYTTDDYWIPAGETQPIKIPEVMKLNKSIKNPKLQIVIKEIMAHMVDIPPGSFKMGDKFDGPEHQVILTKGFKICKYIVSQRIWTEVMGKLPPTMRKNQRNPDYPIFNINFYDMKKFIEILNSNSTGGKFDLPTEAQWEYCCKAGTSTLYFFGDRDDKINQYVWNKNNSERSFHPVNSKKPNPWGLYNMLGLVYENVRDSKRKYSTKKMIDPIGDLNGRSIGARGGSWGKFPARGPKSHFRCASRPENPKTEQSHRLSFRLVWLPD